MRKKWRAKHDAPENCLSQLVGLIRFREQRHPAAVGWYSGMV
jgi:hypothetical protein